jgi:hypothetical protein
MKTILLVLMALVSVAMADAQNIDSWTAKTLNTHFEPIPVGVHYSGGKIKTITFSVSQKIHGPQAFDVILDVLRGYKADDTPTVDPEVDYDDPVWVDHRTGCTITQRLGPSDSGPWEFTVTKQEGTVVLRAHLVEKRSGAKLILEIVKH